MYVLQIKSAKCKVQKVQNAATYIKQLSGQMYLVGRSDFRGWRSVEGIQEKPAEGIPSAAQHLLIKRIAIITFVIQFVSSNPKTFIKHPSEKKPLL